MDGCCPVHIIKIKCWAIVSGTPSSLPKMTNHAWTMIAAQARWVTCQCATLDWMFSVWWVTTIAECSPCSESLPLTQWSLQGWLEGPAPPPSSWSRLEPCIVILFSLQKHCIYMGSFVGKHRWWVPKEGSKEGWSRLVHWHRGMVLPCSLTWRDGPALFTDTEGWSSLVHWHGGMVQPCSLRWRDGPALFTDVEGWSCLVHWHGGMVLLCSLTLTRRDGPALFTDMEGWSCLVHWHGGMVLPCSLRWRDGPALFIDIET